MDMKKTFSENLKKAIASRNMNQAKLAEKAGVSAQNVSKYCRAEVLPDLGAVVQIANALEVSVDSLLGNDDLLRAKKAENFTLADLLSEFVLIADTLNFCVSENTCYFEEQKLGFDYEEPQLQILDFWKKWTKYRKMLENHDIEKAEYHTLVNAKLKQMDHIHLSKDEMILLNLARMEKETIGFNLKY